MLYSCSSSSYIWPLKMLRVLLQKPKPFQFYWNNPSPKPKFVWKTWFCMSNTMKTVYCYQNMPLLQLKRCCGLHISFQYLHLLTAKQNGNLYEEIWKKKTGKKTYSWNKRDFNRSASVIKYVWQTFVPRQNVRGFSKTLWAHGPNIDAIAGPRSHNIFF